MSNNGDEDRERISPLKRFLNKSSVDDLLTLIHGLHLQFSLICNAKGRFRMEIFQEAMLKYAGTGTSPKSAIVNALGDFLTGERKDFHVYERKGDEVAARGKGRG